MHASIRTSVFPAVLLGLALVPMPLRAQVRLAASPVAADDGLGMGVAHDGNRAVIGAYQFNASGPGRAFVFERPAPGAAWSQVALLAAPGGAAGDRFGERVAIEGEWLAIGAIEADLPGAANAGAVFLYHRSAGAWTFSQKLTAPAPEADDRFGSSLSMSGNALLVGAYLANPNGADSGAAHVYRRTGPATWSHEATLLASDGAPDDRLGWAVALEGTTAVVGAYVDDDPVAGADAGSAHVYEFNGTAWVPVAKLLASPPVAGETFGRNIALSGDRLLVSALGADAGGADAGAAYMFERAGGTWAQVARLASDSPAALGYFGWWVDVCNNRALVSAVGDGALGVNSGTVHVFTRDASGAWPQTARLNSPAPAAGDTFGVCVSLTDDCAIVGTIGDDFAAVNGGAAFAFDLPTSPASTATTSWQMY